MRNTRTVPASVLALVLAVPCYAKTNTVTCADGTTAKAGRGACSHHGGVADTASAPPAKVPESSRATAPTSAAAPKSGGEEKGQLAGASGATACKDGTYSHAAHHQGACSRQGGVAEWLGK